MENKTPIIETCAVIKDKGKTAIIELVRSPKCDGCNACAFNKRKSIRVPAIKDAACGAGDLVTVVMPEKQITLAPLFLFVIPILLTLVAVLIGRNWPAWGQAIVIVGFLALGIAVAFAADRLYRRQRKFMPVITACQKGEQHDRPEVD